MNALREEPSLQQVFLRMDARTAPVTFGIHHFNNRTMRTLPALLLASAVILVAWASPSDPVDRGTTMDQEQAARQLYNMFNTGKLDGIEKLCAADFKSHQMHPAITTTGLQGIRDMLAIYFTAVPDFHQEILGISTSGDRTYLHLRITGTNSGAWPDMPATGKAIDVQGVDIVRFANGKAVEHWGYMEEVKMMEQLGLMPAEEPKK